MFDAPEVRRARAADDAGDLITFVEQQLGKVRTVLSGDAGNQRALGHEIRDYHTDLSELIGRIPARMAVAGG